MGSEEELQKEVDVSPTLQFCVLCDNVTNTPDGKTVLSGVFDKILRPATLPQFFIALRWINGFGEHKTIIRILDPELKEHFKSPDIPFKLMHRASPADSIMQIVNFNFPKSGVYWVEILLDNENFSAFPLPVFEEVKEIQ